MWTRIVVGSALVLGVLGLLFFDPLPLAPLLFLTVVGMGTKAAREMELMLPQPGPRPWIAVISVGGVLASNWLPQILGDGNAPGTSTGHSHAGLWVGSACALTLAMLFLVEGSFFQGPNGAVPRIALTFFCVGYIGLLASFLTQLRWLPGDRGQFALALGIFIPKGCDIGAYFTGRFLGRTPMAPVLSPKKTWEGAIGGLLSATLASLFINALSLTRLDQPLLPWWSALLLGSMGGVVAELGDLSESLIKRDCARKDAAQDLPEFGGSLDVIDSLLLTAPLIYWWLH
jgi:phosphatidate cytidylyltransferase